MSLGRHTTAVLRLAVALFICFVPSIARAATANDVTVQMGGIEKVTATGTETRLAVHAPARRAGNYRVHQSDLRSLV